MLLCANHSKIVILVSFSDWVQEICVSTLKLVLGTETTMMPLWVYTCFKEFMDQYQYLMHVNVLSVPKWSVFATGIRTLPSVCALLSSSCVYHVVDTQTCYGLSFINIVPLMKVKESSFLCSECWYNACLSRI